ncbi:lipocalin family protein [Halocola ammonii]
MKKYFFLLLTIGILASCTKDKNNPINNSESEVIGTWKLVEVYLDPGDGSGDFEPVDSEKTVTFHEDGTITSNGDLCSLSQEANGTSSGTYSLQDSTLNLPECTFDGPSNYTFEQEGNTLIINAPCDEPCRVKYVRD